MARDIVATKNISILRITVHTDAFSFLNLKSLSTIYWLFINAFLPFSYVTDEELSCLKPLPYFEPWWHTPPE